MLREKLDHLTESHLVIRKRINLLKQVSKLFLAFDEALANFFFAYFVHDLKKSNELLFINDSMLAKINNFKYLQKVAQKLSMFVILEVEDTLLEV